MSFCSIMVNSVVFSFFGTPEHVNCLQAVQDVDADMHRAKLDAEGRLAAMRKEILAAEDKARAELELEYRQATQS